MMRLSKRGEYGLRAMIDLVIWEAETGHGTVQIKEVAEREIMPAKFLEQTFLTLKNAGLLHSKMGLGGDYCLAKPTGKITLRQIIHELDEPLTPKRCVSQMASEHCGCPDEETRGLRLAIFDVRNTRADILDHTSLAEVTERVDKVRSTREKTSQD